MQDYNVAIKVLPTEVLSTQSELSELLWHLLDYNLRQTCAWLQSLGASIDLKVVSCLLDKDEVDVTVFINLVSVLDESFRRFNCSIFAFQ